MYLCWTQSGSEEGGLDWADGIWIRKYKISGEKLAEASFPGVYQRIVEGHVENVGNSKLSLGICGASGGGCWVLWLERIHGEEAENDYNLPEICTTYARHLNSFLEPVGELIKIRTLRYLHSTLGSIASAEDGSFVIVWQDNKYELRWGQWTSTKTFVYAQRFDPSGKRVGDPIVVAQQGLSEPAPRVAVDSQGNFLVTWSRGPYLMAARFDKNGNRIGRSFSPADISSRRCMAVIGRNGKIAFAYSKVWVGEGKPYGPIDDMRNIFLRVIDFYALPFLRGDANSDEAVDLADALWILSYLFGEGDPPAIPDAADTNHSGVIDLSDPIYLLRFLFLEGVTTLPHPYPYFGYDPTPDEL